MNLQVLREKSAKAAADARSMRDEFNTKHGSPDKWPAEAHAAFDRACDDATTAVEELRRCESTATKSAFIDAIEVHHTAPATGFPTAAVTSSAPKADARREAHAAAQRYWMRGDFHSAERILRDAGMEGREVHALIAGDGSKGGFLTTPDFQQRVIERRAATSISMGLCQVIPTTGSELMYPRIAAATSNPTIYGSGFTGDWDTEQGSTTESSGTVTVKTQQTQPRFEQARIPVNEWVPSPVVASMSLLDDAPAAEQIITRQIGTTFGLDVDSAVLGGNGTMRPMGILTETSNSNITTVNSGSNSGLTYGGLVDFAYALPAQYAQGATAVMRRATFGAMLKLETGSGTTLVFPNNGVPNNFFGYPVAFSDFMPAHSTQNNLAIIFGNFSEGYVIAERSDLRIQRLVERYAPNVGFAPVARIGGGVVLPEAFRVLKISA